MHSSHSLNIISSHETLSEAVAAAVGAGLLNLDYNPKAAQDRIKDLECGFRGCKSGRAYVTLEGVFFIFHADIKLLNKFEPFISVLDDRPLRVAIVCDLDKKIVISDNLIAKSAANRKLIASLNLLVTGH